MSLEIQKLAEPDEGVMLVSTEAYNKLVDALNALMLMQVKPQGVGKLLVGDKNAVLDLSGFEQYIYGLVQAAQNGGGGGGANGGGGSGGTPPGGGGGGGGGGGTITGPISASGRCLPNGDIEITIRTG